MQRITDSFNKQTFMHTLGAELTHVAEGEVDITLPSRQDIRQQHGFVHAGAITTVIDTACGYAALTTMPESSEVVTVELKINFMSPALGDAFVAKGRVIKAGRNLTITQGDVYAIQNDAKTEKHIATMQATMFRVESE